MEREFTDLDEWLRYGGDPTYGQGVGPTDGYVPPLSDQIPPWSEQIPSQTTPAPGRPRRPRDEVEREGRASDEANGRIGGYYNEETGEWVNGSPRGGGYTPAGGVESLGGGQNPNEGFVWPTLNLPRASFRDFGGFKPFVQPSPDEILNDPVLQAQLKEGNNRIKQDRAFRGVLNTGDTLKDIFDWTSDRIKLGGHDAFDRAFKVYDVNERQNPFNTWSANKDKYFQEFNTNLGSSRDEFLFNQYNPAKALWDQNYNKWAKTGDWLTQQSMPPD